MCGRFVRKSSRQTISKRFNVEPITCELPPSYNIAPTQQIMAIIPQQKLVALRWGLIPSWAKDKAIGHKMINARIETLDQKPSFRNAFKKRRCLIVADGFYEWQKQGDEKNPIYIHLTKDEPFAFAGLYESWISPEGEIIDSCTIITTSANEQLTPIHHRMPVILSQEVESIWLDPKVQDTALLKSLLIAKQPLHFQTDRVTQMVNSSQNNSPACIKPVHL